MAPKASTSASSFTPTLPTRQVPARLASIRAKHKIEATLHLCKFTTLPTELLDMIEEQIEDEDDVLSSAATCKLFWAKWGLDDDWPLNTWSEGLGSRVPDRVPLFRMAKHKKGNLPFYVENAERDGDDRIVLNTVYVESDDLHREFGRVFLDCWKWGQNLSIDQGGCGNQEASTGQLDWEDNRRQMMTATPSWLAAKFPCPTCNDKGDVFAGAKKVAERSVDSTLLFPRAEANVLGDGLG